MPDLLTVVIRGFGYSITHIAQVPRDALEPAHWPSPAYPFTAVRTPVAGICGTSARSVQPCVVVMQPGTPVRCRTCSALATARGLETSYPAVHDA